MATDKQLRDAAVAELKLTTVGWNKVASYPPVKLATTHWGKAMNLLAQIEQAPSPLPPASGDPIDSLDDLQGVFNMFRPQVGQWGQETNITAPPYAPWAHGPGVSLVPGGFKFVVTEEMVAPWDATTKVCMFYDHPSPLGSTEDARFKLTFPSAGNPDGFSKAWHNGELWQWHTSINSGMNININSDGTFRFMVHNEAGAQANPGNPQLPWFHIIKGPLIRFDHPHDFRIRVKWSHGIDGTYELWLDGQKLLDFHEPTLHPGDLGYLQFGFYSVRQLRNEALYTDISIERL